MLNSFVGHIDFIADDAPNYQRTMKMRANNDLAMMTIIVLIVPYL